MYRVVSVLGTKDNGATAQDIEDALNQLEAEGYKPVDPQHWVRNGHHWLITGIREVDAPPPRQRDDYDYVARGDEIVP